jgi:hypothetical protein
MIPVPSSLLVRQVTTYSRSSSPTVSERSYRVTRGSSPVQSKRGIRRTTVHRYGTRRQYTDDRGCCDDGCCGSNGCGDDGCVGNNRCCDNRCCRRLCYRGRSRRVIRRNRKSFDPEYGDDYYVSISYQLFTVFRRDVKNFKKMKCNKYLSATVVTSSIQSKGFGLQHKSICDIYPHTL